MQKHPESHKKKHLLTSTIHAHKTNIVRRTWGGGKDFVLETGVFIHTR